MMNAIRALCLLIIYPSYGYGLFFGVIYPEEKDSYFESYQGFTLECTTTRYFGTGNSSQLYWEHAPINSFVINQDWVVPVSSSTSRLTVPPEYATSKATGDFICMMNETGKSDTWVAQRSVMVVDPPPQIKDFRCVTSDMMSANCTFCPDMNQTTDMPYFSDFRWAVPKLNRSGECEKEQCSHRLNNLDTDRHCYFLMAAEYEFSIETSNRVGKTLTIFNVTTDGSIVKADPVDALQVIPSSRKFDVSWTYPEKLKYYRSIVHLRFNVCVWPAEKAQPSANQCAMTELTEISIPNLKPNTKYKVSVTSKPEEGGYVSEPTSLVHETNIDAPEEGPVVVPGSYRVTCPASESKCVLQVYWENVPESKCNGRIVQYKVRYWLGPNSRESLSILKLGHEYSSMISFDHTVEWVNQVAIYAYTKAGDDSYMSPSSTLDITYPFKETEAAYKKLSLEEYNMATSIKDKTHLERSGDKVVIMFPEDKNKPLLSNIIVVWCPGNPLNLDEVSCKNGTGLSHDLIPSGATLWTSPSVEEDVMFNVVVNFRSGRSSGMIPARRWLCIYDDGTKTDPPIPEMSLTQSWSTLSVSWEANDCLTRQKRLIPKIYIASYQVSVFSVKSGEKVEEDNVYGDLAKKDFEGLSLGEKYRVEMYSVSGHNRTSSPAEKSIEMIKGGLIWWHIVLIVIVVLFGLILLIGVIIRCRQFAKNKIELNIEIPDKDGARLSMDTDQDAFNYVNEDSMNKNIEKVRHDSSRSSGYNSQESQGSNTPPATVGDRSESPAMLRLPMNNTDQRGTSQEEGDEKQANYSTITLATLDENCLPSNTDTSTEEESSLSTALTRDLNSPSSVGGDHLGTLAGSCSGTGQTECSGYQGCTERRVNMFELPPDRGAPGVPYSYTPSPSTKDNQSGDAKTLVKSEGTDLQSIAFVDNTLESDDSLLFDTNINAVDIPVPTLPDEVQVTPEERCLPEMNPRMSPSVAVESVTVPKNVTTKDTHSSCSNSGSSFDPYC